MGVGEIRKANQQPSVFITANDCGVCKVNILLSLYAPMTTFPETRFVLKVNLAAASKTV